MDSFSSFSANYFYKFLGLTMAFDVVLIFVLLVLLFLSFLLAGSEVAFFSLNYKEINVLKTKQQESLRRIVQLLDKPKVLLASILIANCFVNIGIILILNTLIDEAVAKSGLATLPSINLITFVIKLVFDTVLILLFAEILPKIWATHRNIFFASTAGPIVDFVVRIISGLGLGKWLIGLSNAIERALGAKYSNVNLGTKHIDDAIDLLSEEEATEEEKQILKGIRKFGDTTAKQVMRSRLDVHSIDYDVDFDSVKNLIEEYHYSRIPIVKGTLDEVVGLLHTKDVLPHIQESANYDWRKHIRQPYFIHEQRLIDDLLQEFRQKRIHFAFVADEFGGTSGIVTLEDIMEEVIGDIKDEFDDDELSNKKIDDYTYIFDGKTSINDTCKIMDINADTFDEIRGDSDTIAGLVLELYGGFPNENETIKQGDFTFVPTEIKNNRIGKVKVLINPNLDNNASDD